MDGFRKVITASVPASKVYEALTTLDGLSHWWTEDTRGDGETFTFCFDDTYVTMQVIKAEPSKEVVWKCIDQYFRIEGTNNTKEWINTKVRFMLSENFNKSTMISFEHEGLTPRLACFGDCSASWTHFLQSLRNYLETGIGSPYESTKKVS